MKNSSIAPLVIAALVAAALSTLLVSGRWLIWIPLLLALAAGSYVTRSIRL